MVFNKKIKLVFNEKIKLVYLAFVLDLGGNILKCIGRPRPHGIGRVGSEATILMDPEYPTVAKIGGGAMALVYKAQDTRLVASSP